MDADGSNPGALTADLDRSIDAVRWAGASNADELLELSISHHRGLDDWTTLN
jgi:hypothetical protein